MSTKRTTQPSDKPAPRRVLKARQPARKKYRAGPKAVGSFVPTVTKKVFEKYGFSTASLLTDWAAIVGKDLAAYTVPEKLNWPRGVDIYADSNVPETGSRSKTSKAEKARQGATLVLRVDGPRAVEIPYKAGQIIERINAYFGYCAISEMRIVQAPFSINETTDTAKYEKLDPPELPPEQVAGIEDQDLRGALAMMAAGLARRAKRTKHS